MNAHTPIHQADPLSIEIGHRIRMMRERARLSQTALGEAIGVSFQQVQKYERGTNRVAVPALFGIAKALGVSAARLVEGLDGPERAGPLVDPRLVEATAGLSPKQLDAVIAVARAFG